MSNQEELIEKFLPRLRREKLTTEHVLQKNLTLSYEYNRRRMPRHLLKVGIKISIKWDCV